VTGLQVAVSNVKEGLSCGEARPFRTRSTTHLPRGPYALLYSPGQTISVAYRLKPLLVHFIYPITARLQS
jgi:hypothetical protein